MSMLILAICFGISVSFTLWAIYGDVDSAEVEEARSRRRILIELGDIEIHRPTHIIDCRREL